MVDALKQIIAQGWILRDRRLADLGIAYMGAACVGYGLAVILKLTACHWCELERWLLFSVGLSLFLSAFTMRFRLFFLMGALVLSIIGLKIVGDHLAIENAVRLETFAYYWQVAHSVDAEQALLLEPTLQSFYALTWLFKKLPFYAGLLFVISGAFTFRSIGQFVLKSSHKLKILITPFRPKQDALKRHWIQGLTFLLGTMACVHAKDLGKFGETFAIVEEDLLYVLQTRLEKLIPEAISAMNTRMAQEAESCIERPRVVNVIPHTRTPRTFSYDPSIRVPFDLKDHKGQVFAHKGMRVNPLETHTLSRPWLFIDGDNERQVRGALTHPLKPKIILVQGAPLTLMRDYKTRFYFDQGHVLIHQLGITHVPALVRQHEHLFLIEEVRF